MPGYQAVTKGDKIPRRHRNWRILYIEYVVDTESQEDKKMTNLPRQWLKP